MDKNDELALLRERADSLDRSIKALDQDIEGATHDLARGEDPGRAISFLQDCHNRQLGLMYDLGKADRQIEDLENRAVEERERLLEQQSTEEWQDDIPAPEDQLDWFKKSLQENPPQRDEREPAEERQLEDMERDSPAPEDHLDWFDRRG